MTDTSAKTHAERVFAAERRYIESRLMRYYERCNGRDEASAREIAKQDVDDLLDAARKVGRHASPDAAEVAEIARREIRNFLRCSL
jgi:hypothetical protein